MKRFLLVILSICVLGCNTAQKKNSANTNLQNIIHEFDSQIKKDVENDNIDGSISFTIVKGNQIIHSNAHGMAKNGTKANTSTIYRTGSISKSFTAFLMMQLVEEGVVALNDPIEKYLPEAKQLIGYSENTKITLEQLASHTSGLIREPGLNDAASGPIQEWEHKILYSILKTSFQSNPGQRYSYSNIGYGMLGLALSRAANTSFITLVEEKIFEPLQMNHSFFVVPENRLQDLADGMLGGPTTSINKEIPKKEHAGRGYKVPNGGIYSTPNDLAKFMFANTGYSKIISDESLAIMQSKKTPENRRQSYGLGFSLYKDETFSSIGHGGSVAGYTAYFLFDRESQYGVILMRNYNSGTTNLGLRSATLLRKLKDFDSQSK